MSESTLVKISHCWKSHGVAHFMYIYVPLSKLWGIVFLVCVHATNFNVGKLHLEWGHFVYVLSYDRELYHMFIGKE